MATTRLTLAVADVLGRPPQAGTVAEVKLTWTDARGPVTQQVTVPLDRPVTRAVPAEEWSRIDLDVAHPDYAPESVALTRSSPGAPVYWDNRGVGVTRDGDDLRLTMELGRIRQSPVTPPPFTGTKARGDQPGVFFREVPGQPRRYAVLNTPAPPATPLWLEKVNVRTLTDAAPARAEQEGWDRFATTDRVVALADTGGFLWLEYGADDGAQPPQPRFLVAVWAPKQPPSSSSGPSSGSSSAVDVVCYFTPSTATRGYPVSAYPFRTGYPYSVRRDTAADQPYVVVGYRHLLRDLGLVHAQHVSGRPAVVVVPILPALPPGKENERFAWQPFNSQEGTHRLLLEVVRFLHRFGYGGSGSGTDFSRWQGGTAPVGRLPPLPAARRSSSVSAPPPALGNVTVSGFSSAIMGIFPLLTRKEISLPDRFPRHLFGGDAAAFDGVWREWWDLDLELKAEATGISAADYERRLLQWFAGGNDRRLRLYHCDHTMGKTPPARRFAALARLPHKAAVLPGLAEEWHSGDGRWTAAFYRAGLLRARTRPDDVLPRFPLEAGDAGLIHPFTAALGFGHASKLRAV
ncbi:hypothetical protein EF910_08095 [Streptomyces sp. WAC07149]|uniref:hypothetical protein n=1 Tax=Streptomyces sp. WAC07149 TaxID=2487425 RepID=UPI000F7AF76C|nr:hypothetical protein [Streptomyces sp. WAC07149]RST06934.1 hypothetical protein EF910_08095 [Streptomyces sp. WAC07149]